MTRHVFITALMCCTVIHVIAQHWRPGDTLNTSNADTNRIDQFRNNVIDYTGQDLIDAAFPNSWPLFGSKARMAIGGYAKLDYIQDIDGGYDRFQYEVHNVPIEGDDRPAQNGYMNMHSRESRFNVDVRSITKTGMPVRVFFELDFYNLDRGPFNQAARLRHFYGVIGRLLFGRTWGTQTDLFALPTTIDFAAGDAISASRRAQVRFEDKIGDNTNYAFALEMLEFPEIDGNNFTGQASMEYPVLVGRITQTTSSGGRYFLGASAYQLRWDGMDSGPNATEFGWGVSFSGRQYIVAKKHYFRWVTSYGNGWGSNIISTIGSGTAAILTPEGKLETMTSWNLSGGFSFYLSKVLMANLNATWFELEPSEYRTTEKIKAGGAAHINLIWSPYKSVNTGIEYIIARRVNGDGKTGTGRRVQAMIKYLF